MPAPRPEPGDLNASLALPAGTGLDSPRALVADAEGAYRVSAPSAAPAAPGQAFADLLLLGALACQAPAALLSVPQPDGAWSTLSYGMEAKDGLNDGLLFEVLAGRDDPFEIVDMVTAIPASPLIHPPHSMRWAYGCALRGETGALLGVVAVVDRWIRQLSKREHRAMASLTRQLGAHLAGIRRPSPAAFTRPELRAASPRGVGSPVRQGPADRRNGNEAHHLLRSHEVAVMFDVTERTVINWAAAGKLPSLRTMGGHLRFRREDVMRLVAGATDPGIDASRPSAS